MILQIIDVLVGLTAVYLIFSTIASSLFELVESVLKKRGELLARGIREMFARIVTGSGDIRDCDADSLLADFYRSPHIYSLFDGDYQPGGRNLPSYIPAERFVGALMTLAKNGSLQAEFTQIRNTMMLVSGIDLAVIEQNAEADYAKVRAQLMAYFDSSMERVSGWYARHARVWLLGIGLVLAGLFNIDTLQLITQLSQNDALRENVVTQVIGARDALEPGAPVVAADATADADWTATRTAVDHQLQLVDALGLPVGWKRDDWPRATRDLASIVYKLFGLVLTALALSVGAPFWFTLLNQLVNLRAALKPGSTDSDDEAPAKPAAAKAAGGPPAADPEAVG